MKELNLGYQFQNKALLQEAITHSSYANERHCAYNERLEFLGDSVLSIIISRYLFEQLPGEKEGVLSKLRSALVCEGSLAKLADRIGLGEALLLGRGEELGGGRKRPSILSDAFEAVLAAMYLDSDLKTVETWLLSLMKPELDAALRGDLYQDYKTRLQEAVQQNGDTVSYRTVSETGPDHHKDFMVEVLVNDVVVGKGNGFTRKEAEQNAAKRALEHEAL